MKNLGKRVDGYKENLQQQQQQQQNREEDEESFHQSMVAIQNDAEQCELEVDKLKTFVDQLKSEIRKKEEKKDIIEKKMEEVSNKLKNTVQDIKDKGEKNYEMEKTIEMMKAYIRRHVKENRNERGKNQMVDYQKDVSKIQEMTEKIMMEIKEDNRNDTLDTLKAKIKERKEEKENVQETVNTLKQQVQEKERKINVLDEEYERLEARKKPDDQIIVNDPRKTQINHANIEMEWHYNIFYQMQKKTCCATCASYWALEEPKNMPSKEQQGDNMEDEEG